LATLFTAVNQRQRQANAVEQRPDPEPPDAPASLKWCLGLTFGTCLLAGALVITVGTTELPLDKVPLTLLVWAVVAGATLAMPAATGTLRHGLREKQPDAVLYAAAGFIAAFGALAVTVIVGTG
jgi:hypothetical protein